MRYIITNQELYNALNVSVDLCGDSVAVTFTRDGERGYIESWGDHGPNDFNEFGFQIAL
jgi:hypothetical protein